MSFSSRRRNYLLTPHRRDGLIEWYDTRKSRALRTVSRLSASLLMLVFVVVAFIGVLRACRMKSMLQHSFVLDALETTGADTFSHFEMLIEEHRELTAQQQNANDLDSLFPTSRLKQLVPTIGVFHTPLPLRAAFEVYNDKHRLTKRKHIQVSFNECRHILNLAQIMALRKVQKPEAQKVLATTLKEDSVEQGSSNQPSKADKIPFIRRKFRMESIGSFNDLGEEDMPADLAGFNGPKLISFDGDQTLYSDGQNFERNPRLAFYLYLLLRHGVTIAVVTAAGYEYMVEKYEYRLSGLLAYFRSKGLSPDECDRFYLFGGECNYLLQLKSDYRLHPVSEHGVGGWMSSTKHLSECPANWADHEVQELLDAAQSQIERTLEELNLRGRIIRKFRSVGLVPLPGHEITRESLDETVLRVKESLSRLNGGKGPRLPYCAFNGGTDAWVDVGNKRVGVQVLQSFLGVAVVETLHIGDQFLNTGNDYAARDVSPCIWIINPYETTYILKSILRLASVNVTSIDVVEDDADEGQGSAFIPSINFQEMDRRSQAALRMDVYSGEMVSEEQRRSSG